MKSTDYNDCAKQFQFLSSGQIAPSGILNLANHNTSLIIKESCLLLMVNNERKSCVASLERRADRALEAPPAVFGTVLVLRTPNVVRYRSVLLYYRTCTTSTSTVHSAWEQYWARGPARDRHNRAKKIERHFRTCAPLVRTELATFCILLFALASKMVE